MDAKVLRAAVSAAIRVTVSTTLIGCGGNVTTDAGGARTPETNDAASSKEPSSSVKGSGDQASVPYPVSGTGSSEAKAGSSATAGGAAAGGTSSTGGVEVGGMANAAGADEIGNAGTAGAPIAICGAVADACLTLLEHAPANEPPSIVGKPCCEAMLEELTQLQHANAECYQHLWNRVMQPGVRPQCCNDPSTWQHQACAPWGPPVPPELSLAALLQWGTAA